MRNKIQEEADNSGKNDGKDGDFTPLPFLTTMVRAGILRDLAEAIIAYGLKPKLTKQANVVEATKLFQTFAKGVINAKQLPRKEIIDR